MMNTNKRDRAPARRSLDSLTLQRSEPSFKYTVSFNVETDSIKKKSTRTKRLSLDQLVLSSYIADSISKIIPEDLSTARNTPVATNNNTPRLMDDGVLVASSSTKKSSKSSKTPSFFHRLSIGGGVIIAGSLAQDAIKGHTISNSHPTHPPSTVTTYPNNHNNIHPTTFPYTKGLGLQQNELRLLRSSFDKIDEDKNGVIDRLELLHALDAKDILNNSFTDKVYNMIDMDKNETIGFDEFVRMSATFLMFSHADMVRFVFECYNKSGKGRFGPQDFVDLSKVINSITLNGGPRDWTDALKFDTGCKGYLNEAEFIEMASRYPQFIHFASRLQARLQSISLGDKFYRKIADRQEKARILQEYKKNHNGELPPPEKNSMTAWMRKIASLGEHDADQDLRKSDNIDLLNLGYAMYVKLAETYNSKK